MAEPVLEFRSEQSDAVIYACGTCGRVYTGETRTVGTTRIVAGRELAELCCVCRRCGTATPEANRTLCRDCDALERREHLAARHEHLIKLPVVADDGGAVYVETIDRYFACSDDALDHLIDNDHDPAEMIVHPCDSVKVPVPDLHASVSEHWYEEFDDGDAMELPKPVVEALDAALEVLAQHAPIAWRARTDCRVVIPAAEVAR